MVIPQDKANSIRYVACEPVCAESQKHNDYMLIIVSQLIPLEPRGLLLFLSPKTVNKKSVSAESASLKIACTTLKVRNLFPFHYNFEQTDFLRFVSPIFLTLTSQGGNQGIATQCV